MDLEVKKMTCMRGQKWVHSDRKEEGCRSGQRTPENTPKNSQKNVREESGLSRVKPGRVGSSRVVVTRLQLEDDDIIADVTLTRAEAKTTPFC